MFDFCLIDIKKLALSVLANIYICKKSYKLVLKFLKYILKTSYFDEPHKPVYNVFEKKVLLRSLSKILT